jgi:hypothetical protein
MTRGLADHVLDPPMTKVFAIIRRFVTRHRSSR